MPVSLCQHIKADGLPCRAIALSSRRFCYFHQRARTARPAARLPLPPPSATPHPLLPVTDRDSLQRALSAVVSALAGGTLETRRGTALLYGLQLTSSLLVRPSASHR